MSRRALAAWAALGAVGVLGGCEREPEARRAARPPTALSAAGRSRPSTAPAPSPVGSSAAVPASDAAVPASDAATPASDAATPVTDSGTPPASSDPLAGPASAARATVDAGPLPPPGQLVEVEVPGDRPLLVAHAAREQLRAMVYFHGICGDPHAVEPWLPAVSRWATLIVLLGDHRCPGTERYRWGLSTARLEERVTAALAVVQTARGGQLRTDSAVLFGYSQGATRAEALGAAHPQRYPLVVLGGTPNQPSHHRLAKQRAVAVLGGQYEPHLHMLRGVAALERAGIRSRWFELPRGHHGSYGPQANEVLSSLFAWLFAESPG